MTCKPSIFSFPHTILKSHSLVRLTFPVHLFYAISLLTLCYDVPFFVCFVIFFMWHSHTLAFAHFLSISNKWWRKGARDWKLYEVEMKKNVLNFKNKVRILKYLNYIKLMHFSFFSSFHHLKNHFIKILNFSPNHRTFFWKWNLCVDILLPCWFTRTLALSQRSNIATGKDISAYTFHPFYCGLMLIK